MAQYISCSNRVWTAWDLFRVILEGGYVGGGKALRVMHVADSGEQYFCAGNKFTDIDLLARKLVGVDGNDQAAIRVCFSDNSDGNAIVCDSAIPGVKGETNQTLCLSVIGKGTDGEPLIRISCENIP